MPIEKFKTLKEATQFIEDHKHYSLIIKDNFTDQVINTERV